MLQAFLRGRVTAVPWAFRRVIGLVAAGPPAVAKFAGLPYAGRLLSAVSWAAAVVVAIVGSSLVPQYIWPV